MNDKQIKTTSNYILGIKKIESVEELVKIYSASYVFLNPTLEDNFPTTNIEAIACETPVITYNTGGSIEVINKNTGLIIKNNTVEETLKKIKTLNKFKFDIEKERYKYDKEKMIQYYIELYNKGEGLK